MGLLAFFGEYSTDYSSSMAGICLTTIPVIIAYVFFQEKIEKWFDEWSYKGLIFFGVSDIKRYKGKADA